MDQIKAAVAAAVQDQLINDEFWAPLADRPGVRQASASRSSARETMVRIAPEHGQVRYFLVKMTEML